MIGLLVMIFEEIKLETVCLVLRQFTLCLTYSWEEVTLYRPRISSWNDIRDRKTVFY